MVQFIRIKRFYLVYGASGRPLCNPPPSHPSLSLSLCCRVWMTSPVNTWDGRGGHPRLWNKKVSSAVTASDFAQSLVASRRVFHRDSKRVGRPELSHLWQVDSCRFWVCCRLLASFQISSKLFYSDVSGCTQQVLLLCTFFFLKNLYYSK